MGTEEHEEHSAAHSFLHEEAPVGVEGAALGAQQTGILVHSADGQVLFFNPAALRILDLTEDQLLSRAPLPEGWSATEGDGTDVPSSGYPATAGVDGAARIGVEVALRHPGGTRSWLLADAVPLEGATGGLAGAVVTTLTDLTPQIALRQRLVEAEQRFHMVAEASSDVIWTTDDIGRLTWISDSVFAVLGYTPDELLEGVEPMALIFAPDVERATEAMAAMARGEKVQQRLRLVSKSGEPRSVSFSAKQGRDHEGNLVWSGGFRDIEEQVEAEEALAAESERYRLLAENSVDVVMKITGSLVEWISPSVEATFGWSVAEVVGCDPVAFIHPEDRTVITADRDAVLSGSPRLTRCRVRDVTNVYHWVETHTSVFYDADGQPDGLLSSLRVIDREVASEEALRTLAHFDTVTGLLNRAALFEQLRKITDYPRRSGQKTAVLFCDIDDFKSINDSFGHAAGDSLLATVASRITRSLRSDDLVARLGGDEILVVLRGVQNLEGASELAEKVRAAVSRPMGEYWGARRVTLSVGVTLAMLGDGPDSLIARADDAMYKAKIAGRDQVVSV